MTFGDWVANTKAHFRQSDPITAAKASAAEFYVGAALRAFDRLPRLARTNVMGESWDVLVVLDACRVDALREVAPEYDWLPDAGDIGTIRSMGSMSEEWMQETFAAEYPETAHITWNAYSHYNLRDKCWHSLQEVWKSDWDDDLGAVPPSGITDRAIQTWRADRPSRLLLHYQQPHTPYPNLVEDGTVETLTEEQVGGREDLGRLTVWKLLRRGNISHERAWQAYLDALRWVLDDIGRLRENLDAERVILTADHGDCFGEWGLYGHPRAVPAPELITVPWVEIECSDETTVTPEVAADLEADATDTDARERLEALGYV